VTDKRTIIAVVLSAAILFVWTKFFSPTPPVPPPPAPATNAGPASGAGPVAGSNAAPSAEVAAAAAVGAPAAASVIPERDATIETPTERFVFSNRGASLRHATLLEPKYLPRKGEQGAHAGGIDLVHAGDPKLAPLRINFPDSGFPTPADTDWKLVEGTATPAGATQQLIFRAETPAVVVEKRFLFDANRYRMHLDVTVENRAAAPVDHHLAIQVSGYQDAEAKGGFFSGASGNTSSVLCHIGDKTKREALEKLEKERMREVGGVRWLGTDEKFFLTAIVPYPETPPRELTCEASSPAPGFGLAQLTFAGRTIPPGGRTTYSFALYVGPKVVDDLEQVKPGGVDVQLSEAVDVSLAFISRPMLYLLKIFHRFIGNWGVAIIMLTIFIRLLTFYPTQRSLLSAKKMQKLGPKLAVIRKKYENDKQRQSTETMNLYKANGVSPVGGCLPSLIQMPIWIALYSTLNYAVELYREPFVLHIKDLTAKDPFYVTPLLMGGVMFVQMKMSPTSPDNQQQAMMAIMMPVMFTMFSLVLPSGLAVYMLTSYLIGILQQLWINHLDRKANGPTVLAKV
jgi:YidC/Oxa1 family membrane protein insertase